MRNLLIGAGGGALAAACGFSVIHNWQAWAIICYVVFAIHAGKRP